jgi:anhydro-N-acetylmuramic acid kinase
MILNALSRRLNFAYDENGTLAQSGQLLPDLLEDLDLQSYYIALPPKSLGREDVEKVFFPLLDRSDVPVVDLLRTFTEHLARQIAAAHPRTFSHLDQMLVTGGGAHNAFLIERIRAHSPCTIVVPEKNIVDFKEAIVFAFLGLLRMLQKDNALQTVTGASRNSCGGAIYLP